MGKDPEGMSLPGMVGLQCVCVRARVCVCLHPHCICAGIHVCMCISVCVIGSYVYMCMPMCMRECVYAGMCTRVHV